MPDHKPPIVTSLPLGRISGRSLRTWTSLLKKQAVAQARMDAAQNAITAFLEKHLGDYILPPDPDGNTPTVTLSEDGNIAQECCPCLRCQAYYLGISAQDMVQGWIANEMIMPADVPAAMRKAREIDQTKELDVYRRLSSN